MIEKNKWKMKERKKTKKQRVNEEWVEDDEIGKVGEEEEEEE